MQQINPEIWRGYRLQGSRLCHHAVADVAQAVRCDQLDCRTQQLLEIQPKPDEVEQGPPLVEFHEEIDIAVVPVVASTASDSHPRFHANCPFTTVATGPPRKVRPSNGELRLRENDWFTS